MRARTRLVAIGRDKPGEYQRLARRLGVAERFTILPGRDDIPRFLQGADLLLHPARYENTGAVLIEAVVIVLAVSFLSLGLRKIRQSVERDDTPQVRGMINTVRHLVTVEEVRP